MSIDPENPLSIGKRARGGEGSIVTSYNDESLSRIAPVVSENPLVPPSGRRIVTAKRSTPYDPKKGTPTPYNPRLGSTVGAKIPATPVVASVRGNTKVDRCARCKTFIKKGVPHTQAECDRRIAKKLAPKPASSGRKKKFRMTPKRRAYLEALVGKATMGEQAYKVMGSVEKWLGRKEKSLSKHSKKLFVRLLDAFHNVDKRKLQANLRRCGLL